MSLWKNSWIEKSKHWPFKPFQQGKPFITENPVYISACLRSMRLVNVRQGGKRFYGVIHSYISVPQRSGTKAELYVITTPNQLKNQDAKGLNKVLTQSQQLLGPIPYYGGNIEVEIGLFSIKSGPLTE